jgi:hypothetical protein
MPRPRWLVLCAAALAITCGLLIYAETMAFYWDEGFHACKALNRQMTSAIRIAHPARAEETKGRRLADRATVC